MRTSPVFLATLAPLFAIAAPQGRGVFAGPSALSVVGTQTNGAAVPSSTTTAVAIATTAGAPAPSGTSAPLPTLSPSNGTATASAPQLRQLIPRSPTISRSLGSSFWPPKPQIASS